MSFSNASAAQSGDDPPDGLVDMLAIAIGTFWASNCDAETYFEDIRNALPARAALYVATGVMMHLRGLDFCYEALGEMTDQEAASRIDAYREVPPTVH